MGALSATYIGDGVDFISTTELIKSGLKTYVGYNGIGNVIEYSSNVESVVDNGIGNYTVNFTMPISDPVYAVSGTADRNAGINTVQCFTTPIFKSSYSCNLLSVSNAATNYDVVLSALFEGD